MPVSDHSAALLSSTMSHFGRPVHLLLVVDGYFSLGGQDRDDRSFSISWLISVLKSHPSIILDTAHRDGDHSATIWGKFNFATTVPDLSTYDEIWMLGYNGLNLMDASNTLFKKPISDEEILAIARFMEGGGGVLATGDHNSLGSHMAGRIPRKVLHLTKYSVSKSLTIIPLGVRTMRKWYSKQDTTVGIPPNAPRNWPSQGATRADTLQKDVDGDFHFTNQSDDIPQPLNLIAVPGEVGGHHPLFDIGGPSKVLRHYPDHMHEGETLGFGGVETSEPWTLDDELTFCGKTFTEYPTHEGQQEKPQIIATGTIIPDHETTVEPNKLCESGFLPELAKTEAKQINTIAVYDGYKVGKGRVLTDSSFHHFLDLNLIGDPCATAEKTRGFDHRFLRDMEKFVLNCVFWLANARLLDCKRVD